MLQRELYLFRLILYRLISRIQDGSLIGYNGRGEYAEGKNTLGLGHTETCKEGKIMTSATEI